MTGAELARYAVELFGMWSLGFGIGWSVTIFRDAVNKV